MCDFLWRKASRRWKMKRTHRFLNMIKETEQMTQQRLNQRLDINTNQPNEGLRCRWRDAGNRAVLTRQMWDRYGGTIKLWRRTKGEKLNQHDTRGFNYKIKQTPASLPPKKTKKLKPWQLLWKQTSYLFFYGGLDISLAGFRSTRAKQAFLDTIESWRWDSSCSPLGPCW